MAENNSMEYITKMNKALAAWCDCDKDNRGFVLVAYDKNCSDLSAGIMSNGNGIINSLIGAYDSAEAFRDVFEGLCIHVAYKKAKDMMK